MNLNRRLSEPRSESSSSKFVATRILKKKNKDEMRVIVERERYLPRNNKHMVI
jgi:hypothetical protein